MMKIKLSNTDAVQLARAIKGGCLDTDKVEFMKELVANYNPPKKISDERLAFFKRCLYDGMGFTPNGETKFFELICTLEQAQPELYAKWERQILDGQLYRRFIKECFIGLLAVKAVGGKFDILKDADFSFLGE